MVPLQPTQLNNRINSLDIIRGLAILGILVMNIQSFSMPESAYMNPTAFGNFNGIDRFIWMLSHLFFEEKFMALFSMLFGAGIIIFCEHLEIKGTPCFALHYRRMFWLVLFGVLHAYIIWHGDVLFHYGICGLWVFWFRRSSIRTLWITGLLFLSIGIIQNIISQFGVSFMSETQLNNMSDQWLPPIHVINQEIQAYNGDWFQQFAARIPQAYFMETYVLPYLTLWRAGGLMLIGMALYKQGLFTKNIANNELLLTGLLLSIGGLTLSAYGISYNFKYNWAVEYSLFQGSLFNYVGSILVAIGYVHLLIAIINKGWFKSLQKRLACVGRIAFTNYIMQSIICTFIFYGTGLGIFGDVFRWQQMIFVFSVWALQLIYSPLWLTIFSHGPLEWCWRSLTYSKMLPIRK